MIPITSRDLAVRSGSTNRRMHTISEALSLPHLHSSSSSETTGEQGNPPRPPQTNKQINPTILYD